MMACISSAEQDLSRRQQKGLTEGSEGEILPRHVKKAAGWRIQLATASKVALACAGVYKMGSLALLVSSMSPVLIRFVLVATCLPNKTS